MVESSRPCASSIIGDSAIRTGQRENLRVATGTAQTATLPPALPAPSESLERERLIRRQLARTSLHVRLVDLASGIAFWVIGVLLLFLLAALIDHFIGLGLVGRYVALLRWSREACGIWYCRSARSWCGRSIRRSPPARSKKRRRR